MGRGGTWCLGLILDMSLTACVASEQRASTGCYLVAKIEGCVAKIDRGWQKEGNSCKKWKFAGEKKYIMAVRQQEGD
jgi:hypothetical protein